jgi:hypothetical protein
VTWLGADEIPSLSVILQPSGGATIFAGEAGMSRGNSQNKPIFNQLLQAAPLKQFVAVRHLN